ncbi:hypothetical protein LOTGIDRAFT_229475 [Lottia gigantea]|uniref:Uncharacterized protein n=1 Tax=Lottia gigantea TaxID=225164 RepID=V3ZXG4_LOTGI|nr:hypothetical protein LOTGIDRAFT_229475 [Lottia gigantea]ESO85661.1 hypothetical protein LOTGIDRAFT_229475 [Lottia gigantea]
MSTTRRSKRKDKRGGESSTLSGTGSLVSSDSDTPLNRTRHRKSGRLMKKKLRKCESGEQAYDGDKENSSESTSSSTSPIPSPADEYDFDEVDVEPVIEKPKKKPTTTKNSKTQRKSEKSSVKIPVKKNRILASTPINNETNINKDTVKPGAGLKRKNVTTPSEFGPKKRTKKSITPILCVPVTDSPSDRTQSIGAIVRRSKRKFGDSVNLTPAIPKGDLKVGNESDKADSGMFVSPPPRKLLRLTAKDTSTPSDQSKSDSNYNTDIKMGLDETVSILFSPVEKVFTPSPTSDYGSLVSSLSQFSLEQHDIPKPIFEIENPEPELKLNKSINKGYKGAKLKVKKSKNRVSVSKVDAWAEKVNGDFDEIEKFELSIEG